MSKPENAKDLNIGALLEAMKVFETVPAPPGAAVCAVSQYRLLESSVKAAEPGSVVLGMAIVGCVDLRDEEVLFFDTKEDALYFVDAVSECRKYGVDPRPAIDALVARLKKKVGKHE